jgi:hypothetical protein
MIKNIAKSDIARVKMNRTRIISAVIGAVIGSAVVWQYRKTFCE